MLLLSGTKQAKMMERTTDNKYNHNAYYNPETNHKTSAKRPKIGICKLVDKSQASEKVNDITIKTINGAGSPYELFEELQFATYEHANKLRILVETIQQSSMEQELNSCDNCNKLQEALEQVMEVANSASRDFESLQQQVTGLNDRLQEEVGKWQGRCQRLNQKMAEQMKDGKNRRRLAGKTSHSQCNTRTKRDERSLLHQSWIDIAQVYDKNRTQMNSFMDELELAVHEFKHAREKLNVKHLGTMTTVEKEMELLCDSALRSARSQRSTRIQSHRSQSARQRNSMDRSRRTAIEPDGGKKHQKSANSQPTQFTNDTQATPGKRRSPAYKKSPLQPEGPKREKPRAQSTNVSQKALVPPLPIHIITGQNPNPKEIKNKGGRHSNRSSHRPPPPESFRSNRSAHKREDSHRSRDGPDRPDTKRSQLGVIKSGAESQASSRQNISGAIMNGALINPVMLQGAAYQTSKFDKNLENDFDGAEATLNFDTGRLKQFPEEYEILANVEDEDQRILLKQWLFFKYEKDLKLQYREEKLVKQKLQPQPSDAKPKPGQKGGRRTNSNGSNFNVSGASQNSMMRRPDTKLSQLVDISALQLDTSLSEIGTWERRWASKKEQDHLQEAKLSQILAVPNDIPGLKTLTQKDIIEIVENNWKRDQAAKQKDRKVLGWSSDEEDNQQSKTKKSNELESAISPNDIQIQVTTSQQSSKRNQKEKYGNGIQQLAYQIKIENELDHDDNSQSNFQSMLSSLRSNAHPRGDMSSQLIAEDHSFNNESMLEDLDTPHNPQRKNNQAALIHQTPLRTDQQPTSSDSKLPPQLQVINPNATASSEESSFLLQQKKSLEVITEKSEFSNTTYARPGSYRSKQSKQMSSQKNGSMIVPGAANGREINGSGASLNNSSIMINSSRNQIGRNPNQVKSFADISEVINEDDTFFLDKVKDKKHHKRRISNVGQQAPVSINHKISMQSYSTITPKESLQDFSNDLERPSSESKQRRRAEAHLKKLNDQRQSSPTGPSGRVSRDRKKVKKDLSILQELKNFAAENNYLSKAADRKPGARDQKKVGGVVVLNNDGQTESARSYMEKSYLDESEQTSIDHFNIDRLSSLKKSRKALRHPRDILDYQLHHDLSSEVSDDSPIKGIYRSNSELYLKNIDMQDESDNVFIEFNPIIYAPESSPSVPQSTQLATRFRIDSSQLNNLTRMLPLQGSRRNNTRGQGGSVLDSNASMQIHTQLYNQLQRLFLQAQQNALPLNAFKHQSMTGPAGNSFKNILSSANKHKTASDPQQANIGFTQGFNKVKNIVKNGLTVSSGLQGHLFNESTHLQNPEVLKRTLQVLQNLQGQTSQNVNRAVGLLFSNTNVSKDNLITTSTIAQSRLELPRTPVMITKQQQSADTSSNSRVIDERPKLPTSKEGAKHLQNYLQSQIAYQTGAYENSGKTVNGFSGPVKQEKVSKSVDRVSNYAVEDSDQAKRQQKYRLKSSQQQIQKFAKPNEVIKPQEGIKLNQKQIFFQRDQSQGDQREAKVQSQLAMNHPQGQLSAQVSGQLNKGQIVKKINITKLPIRRNQLTNATGSKDARSQQISIQRAKGVVSACSTQNNSLISYNGETSIDLSKILLSGKITKVLQTSKQVQNNKKKNGREYETHNPNSSGILGPTASGNVTAGDASLGSQYTYCNLSYSQTNTHNMMHQSKQHSQHAHSSSIY